MPNEELIIIHINIIHLVMKTLTECQCESSIVVFIKLKIKVINLRSDRVVFTILRNQEKHHRRKIWKKMNPGMTKNVNN